MRNLAQLQTAVTEALLHPAMSEPVAPELAAEDSDPLARLRIYGNTTMISLRNALSDNFPVTARLVGREFFDHLATAYVRRHPPTEPRLSVYGAMLPRFISDFEACRQHPYLADVARLERAIVTAIGEPAINPIEHSIVKELGQKAATARFVFQPSLRFVVTRWPAVEIWQANQDDDVDAEIRLTRRPRYVELRRVDRGVAIAELPRPQFVFRYELARTGLLDRSAARALAVDPLFDLVSELITVFREGLVVKVGLDNHIDNGDNS